MATDYNLPVRKVGESVVMESGEQITLEEIEAEHFGQTIDPNIPAAPSAGAQVAAAAQKAAETAVGAGKDTAKAASKHPIIAAMVIAALGICVWRARQ